MTFIFQNLKSSRSHGREKLDSAVTLGEKVLLDTAESGRAVIQHEIDRLVDGQSTSLHQCCYAPIERVFAIKSLLQNQAGI